MILFLTFYALSRAYYSYDYSFDYMVNSSIATWLMLDFSRVLSSFEFSPPSAAVVICIGLF
jgi:hypothetical protein